MNIWDPRRVIWLALAAAPLWACGDDGDPGDESSAGKGGAGVAGAKATGGSKPNDGGGGASAGEVGEPTEPGVGGEGGVPTGIEPSAGAGGELSEAGSGGTGPSGEGGEGGGDQTPVNVCPALPTVLSLSGCTGVGPLCSVSQDDCEFTANCGGRLFEGELQANGNFTLEGADVTAANGAVTETTCAGQVRPAGVTASCSNTVTPTEGEASTTQCQLAVDPLVAPGISCIALPKRLKNLVLAPQAPLTGASVTLGSCDINSRWLQLPGRVRQRRRVHGHCDQDRLHVHPRAHCARSRANPERDGAKSQPGSRVRSGRDGQPLLPVDGERHERLGSLLGGQCRRWSEREAGHQPLHRHRDGERPPRFV